MVIGCGLTSDAALQTLLAEEASRADATPDAEAVRVVELADVQGDLRLRPAAGTSSRVVAGGEVMQAVLVVEAHLDLDGGHAHVLVDRAGDEVLDA